MEYFVYKNSLCAKEKLEINKDYEIKMFKPLPWKLYFDMNVEKISFQTSFFRLYISLLSFGKTKIYFAIDKNNGNILHSSYIIPRNFKYPFLKKGEYCIGPCNTAPMFRGRGIYPYVLRYILCDNPDIIFKMIIKEENTPSINGVKKADFKLTTEKVRSSLILNRFVSIAKGKKE